MTPGDVVQRMTPNARFGNAGSNPAIAFAATFAWRPEGANHERDGYRQAVMFGIWLLVTSLSIAAAGFCFDYALWAIIGRDIPWPVDCIAGMLSGGFAVPVAVACWVARLCGIPVPFVHI